MRDTHPCHTYIQEFEGQALLITSLLETPNPEMSIAPRIGLVVLAPGRKRTSLEEGRYCLSFFHSGPKAPKSISTVHLMGNAWQLLSPPGIPPIAILKEKGLVPFSPMNPEVSKTLW